jgi:hypothetical protein
VTIQALTRRSSSSDTFSDLSTWTSPTGLGFHSFCSGKSISWAQEACQDRYLRNSRQVSGSSLLLQHPAHRRSGPGWGC